ncbi:hypothetical protein [Desulfovirgula thermocuniculi]|uniref:hypothetical protein n=1 Tax=Desulfovirgula thermocuniculi TaxID=348842 RepID=UPI0004110481|nr:hypothetical protein [Desulfovirgula thermocuniculi]
MSNTYTDVAAVPGCAGDPLPAARAGLRAAVREILAVAREAERELAAPEFAYGEAARLVARLEQAVCRVRLAANSLYYVEKR